MTDASAIGSLIDLVRGGMTVDRAETEVERPDGWARPALLAWAQAQGLGYAALADHLHLSRNTVKSWWQRARTRGQASAAVLELEPAPAESPRPGLQRASPPPRVAPAPSSSGRPPPRSGSPPDDEGKRSHPELGHMDREAFLVWLIGDITQRLCNASPAAAGIAPQLISQLRAARNELDEYRTEHKRGKVDYGDDMTEAELLEKMVETAPELPDVYLEVYVEVYLARHELQVVERARAS